MQEIITIGFKDGEADFGVNGSLRDLSFEQMNKLRAMTMVAIGMAEDMWRYRDNYGSAEMIGPGKE